MDAEEVQTRSVRISLFDVIPLKEIEVVKIPTTYVVPLGNTVRN